MRVRIGLALALVAVALAGGFWLWWSRAWDATVPGESPRERAVRVCGACGLDVETVDWLIDSMGDSTLSSEGHLRLFREQFEEPADAELCEPCATAVIAAAAP